MRKNWAECLKEGLMGIMREVSHEKGEVLWLCRRTPRRRGQLFSYVHCTAWPGSKSGCFFLRFSSFSLGPSQHILALYLKLGHDHWSTLCNPSYWRYCIFIWLWHSVTHFFWTWSIIWCWIQAKCFGRGLCFRPHVMRKWIFTCYGGSLKQTYSDRTRGMLVRFEPKNLCS